MFSKKITTDSLKCENYCCNRKDNFKIIALLLIHFSKKIPDLPLKPKNDPRKHAPTLVELAIIDKWFIDIKKTFGNKTEYPDFPVLQRSYDFFKRLLT